MKVIFIINSDDYSLEPLDSLVNINEVSIICREGTDDSQIQSYVIQAISGVVAKTVTYRKFVTTDIVSTDRYHETIPIDIYLVLSSSITSVICKKGNGKLDITDAVDLSRLSHIMNYIIMSVSEINKELDSRDVNSRYL